jgi:hypothetical protein
MHFTEVYDLLAVFLNHKTAYQRRMYIIKGAKIVDKYDATRSFGIKDGADAPREPVPVFGNQVALEGAGTSRTAYQDGK